MPRNANKRRCQVPGCRSWAMRNHTHCRPHRDLELGPRGAGAPPGNLNAVRTGQHAHPISPDQRDRLVQAILSMPEQLPQYLAEAIEDIHQRCPDPVKALAALQAMIPELLIGVADGLYVAELRHLLQQQPVDRRRSALLAIELHARRLGPVHRLDLVRKLRCRLQLQAGAAGTAAGPSVTPAAVQASRNDD